MTEEKNEKEAKTERPDDRLVEVFRAGSNPAPKEKPSPPEKPYKEASEASSSDQTAQEGEES